MHTFLALYRGDTVSRARVVGVIVDPELAGMVAMRLLDTPPEDDDQVLCPLERGKRHALQRIVEEGRPDAP